MKQEQISKSFFGSFFQKKNRNQCLNEQSRRVARQ
jgi:hypothetical protein